jgi:hypothetical protein
MAYITWPHLECMFAPEVSVNGFTFFSFTNTQIVIDAKDAQLAGLFESLDLSISSYDLKWMQDNIEREQEALPDAKGSPQVSDILDVVSKVLRVVKEETKVEYKRYSARLPCTVPLCSFVCSRLMKECQAFLEVISLWVG